MQYNTYIIYAALEPKKNRPTPTLSQTVSTPVPLSLCSGLMPVQSIETRYIRPHGSTRSARSVPRH